MPAGDRRARLALVALTTVWGSTFVVIQSSLEVISPLLLIALRFVVAGLALVALRPALLAGVPEVLVPALPLSLALLGGFALQTSGLATTTPARSAFITSLSVVLVPVFDFLGSRRLPRPAVLAAVALAGTGVYLLFRPIGLEWRRGDTLTLLGTVFFAFYVVELGRLSRRHDATVLVLVQCAVIAVGAGILAATIETPRFEAGAAAAASLAYLGLVCTALTFFLMTWAQARVEPIEAAIIYALEPVLAALFSVALGREHFTANIAAGGALVVVAMLVASATPGVTRRPAPPEGID